MLVISFDFEDTAQQASVYPSQIVNQHFYQEVMQCLRDQVCWKCLEWWQNHDWLIDHDIVPAHMALRVQQFLATKNMAVVPNTPYSPDMAPCDFSLFPRMKVQL